MPRKIVVFGPDNSGKSTLCNTLCKDTGYTYSHSPGPVSIPEMLDYMANHLQNDVNYVFDRFPIIEERTCGKVLRGINKLETVQTIEWWNRIDLYIYCRPKDEIITTWGAREQMSGIKENIAKLIKEYDEVYSCLKSVGYNVCKYDWSKGVEEYNSVLRRVLE